MKKTEVLKIVFFAISAVLTLTGLYLAFIWAPTHETMGDVQRIFYFHVASAWVAYLAFIITFLGSLAYLKTTKMKYDILAFSSAEIGVVFCTAAIITGALWAKGVWGVFWIWEDMKLFMTLVLWLVFLAYLALRTNSEPGKARARLSAVFGIVGFLCIPLSFAANRIWNQYHPTVIASSGGSLQSSMVMALVTAVFAFSFLYAAILLAKMDVEKMREEIEELKQELGDLNE